MNNEFPLPGGGWTNDEELYLYQWDTIATRLCELFSTDTHSTRLIGFDPEFLLTNGNVHSFALPRGKAIALIRNVDGKLPWE